VTGFATVQMQEVRVPLDMVQPQGISCPEAGNPPGDADQPSPA